MGNQPFSSVEDPLTRKYVKLDPISVTTLMKYLRRVTLKVEEVIRNSLPSKFGLILDGWSEGSRHYIAIFACYDHNGKADTPLLAIAPPFDEQNYGADSHVAFIGDVLGLFSKSFGNLTYMVADNAPVNKSIADKIGIPMIGCASHRFNLACKIYLEPYEPVLSKVDKLMSTLRTIKQAGKLRTKTDLEPIKRNVTRWSSTHRMLKRFFELIDFIDTEDGILAEFIPNAVEQIQLKKIMADLDQLDCLTTHLQDSEKDLQDVRLMFDACIERYPMMQSYLARDAKIVHSQAFEDGIVKVIAGDIETLTETEKCALESFLDSASQRTVDSSPERNNFFVIQALKGKKKMKVDSPYPDLKHIPPTSNIVERLFSSARRVLTDYRKSMSPYSFECVMFLKSNRKLWDLSLVAKVMEN